MTAVAAPLGEAPAGIARRQVAAALAVLLILLAAGFIAGRSDHHTRLQLDPIRVVGGVPIGVRRSPAGALAAVDNYLLIDEESIEQNPARFRVLVREAFAPVIQQQAINEAAMVRAGDPAGMGLWASGGRSVTIIGAHRLDSYAKGSAQVTSWVGTVFWGPTQPPKQTSSLARTRLEWAGGRWVITSMLTRLATPGPVPALTPQADASDDTAGVFDNALAGFTALGTGAPGS